LRYHKKLKKMAKSNWNANNIPDLSGKVIIVTGATSGLGKEATKILANKNAKVVMAIRNLTKGQQVVDEIKQQNFNAQIEMIRLDLSSLSSVKTFVEEFIAKYDRLDVLINNAGIMFSPYEETTEGFELQMGSNHFGHFALTGQLLPILKKTPNSRVVATSSLGHKMSKGIDFQDINWNNRKYHEKQAYFDSKLANTSFTYEFAKRYKNDKDAPIIAMAHPGWTSSGLQQHSPTMRILNKFFGQGPKDGVLPTLRAAFGKDTKSGDFFGPSRFFEMHGNPILVESSKLAKDAAHSKKLWDLSVELTNVNY
jgi:NAD(P)-dependent dehydrogenase (short-subunit alcohol dehydrogenase family)